MVVKITPKKRQQKYEYIQPLKIKSRKKETTEGIELPNQENIRKLRDN